MDTKSIVGRQKQIKTIGLDQTEVRIILSTEKLAQLMAQGHLCAAEIKCLDTETKKQVWQACLSSCKHKLGCDDCQLQCANGVLEQEKQFGSC